jgi:hypothetical protein
VITSPTPRADRWMWLVSVAAAELVVVAVLLLVAALAVPHSDATVWFESAVVAGSALVLAGVLRAWPGRRSGADRRLVVVWGLGSGSLLGVSWMAEIGFNNLAPRSLATAGVRGVVDNTTWVVVVVVTVVVSAMVTARTRRWQSGLRAGMWSGLGSGIGAALGGGVLLAVLRVRVEQDPLMLEEWHARAVDTDLAVYVARETLAGVGGHLWVLGLAQGALLGLLAGAATAIVVRSRG